MTNKGEAGRIPIAADRIRDEPESVWVEFIQLALDHKPLNLGQGFPDFAAPQYLIDSLHNATDQSNKSLVLNNQYTRSFGHPRLVRALLQYYRDHRNFSELTEANQQILITVGAYEALFASIMAFVNPGDEVLIVDPAFDAYAPMVAMAQGQSVFVPLRQNSRSQEASNDSALSSSDFSLNMSEFAASITPRTRLLVLNTPNNQLGKMYSRRELEAIANLCIRHNILVLADEVYEQMYYQPNEHLSIAKLPGMWQRTITVGSAGKTFSVTCWKVGWAFGPTHLLRYVQLIHQTAVYTVATPLQEALARAFEHEMELLREGTKSQGYWHQLRADLVGKRNRMAAILRRANMRPVTPEGGYFMLADFSPLANQFPQYKQSKSESSNDYQFARWLSSQKKLQGIPASAFYSAANKHLASNLIRFCFIKEDAALDKLELLIERLLSQEKGNEESGGSQTGAGEILPRSKL